jgi:hypothetical protein
MEESLPNINEQKIMEKIMVDDEIVIKLENIDEKEVKTVEIPEIIPEIKEEKSEQKQKEIKEEKKKKKKKISKKEIQDKINELRTMEGKKEIKKTDFKSIKKKECQKILADMLKRKLMGSMMCDEKIIKEKINKEPEIEPQISQEIPYGAMALFSINETLLHVAAKICNGTKIDHKYKIDEVRMNYIIKSEKDNMIKAYVEMYREYAEVIDEYISPMYMILISNFKIMALSMNGISEKIDIKEAMKHSMPQEN